MDNLCWSEICGNASSSSRTSETDSLLVEELDKLDGTTPAKKAWAILRGAPGEERRQEKVGSGPILHAKTVIDAMVDVMKPSLKDWLHSEDCPGRGVFRGISSFRRS